MITYLWVKLVVVAVAGFVYGIAKELNSRSAGPEQGQQRSAPPD